MSSPIAGKRVGLLSSRASRANGGVFEAVVAQADILRELGAVPVVIAVDDSDHAQDRWRFGEAEVRVVRGMGTPSLAYAPGLDDELEKAGLDMLHLHGIWQYPTHSAGTWARRSGRPLVISPHGMLAPWITGRNAWKKWIGRLGWERRGWSRAVLFHALTGTEAEDIAKEAPSARTVVIANPAPPLAAGGMNKRPPHALYLGRIHTKKNLPALIAGWRQALPKLPDGAQLTIAGWGDDSGIDAIREVLDGRDPSIAFVGTAFGSQKAALFDVSRFLVLPSLSEGLPISVLEAWASGTPTIMSRECHLPQGFAHGAAIESGTSPESIAAALITGFALTEEGWQAMAAAARDLAAGPFGRDTIAKAWQAAYAALFSERAA